MGGLLGHRNRRVVDAARLHRSRERREHRRTILEGPNLLAEAIGTGVMPEVVFAAADDHETVELGELQGFEPLLVDAGALRRLAGTKSPRGPVAVVQIPPDGSISGWPGMVVSWGVADPGNVGTIIRTAAAFGWGFAHTVGTADPWSPKVLRSGAGAQFRSRPIPISRLDDLTAAGYTTVATVVGGGEPPDLLGAARYAVLVGGEAAGLPADVSDAASIRASIPMPGGTESLNAAVAAAIVVYELSRATEYGDRQRES